MNLVYLQWLLLLCVLFAVYLLLLLPFLLLMNLLCWIFRHLSFLLFIQNLTSFFYLLGLCRGRLKSPSTLLCFNFYLLVNINFLYYYTPIFLKSLSNFVNKSIFFSKYYIFLFYCMLYVKAHVLYVHLEHLYIHYIFVLKLDFHVIFLFCFFRL